MEYFSFLERLIDESIEAAKADYGTDPKWENQLQGSLAGFEACRGKSPDGLVEVFSEVSGYLKSSYDGTDNRQYWWFNCYKLEVEFVMNVVSAVMVNSGMQPLLSWLPTSRGMMKAATILNSELG